MDHRYIAEARLENDTYDDVLRYVGGERSRRSQIWREARRLPDPRRNLSQESFRQGGQPFLVAISHDEERQAARVSARLVEFPDVSDLHRLDVFLSRKSEPAQRVAAE
jgi:hypothetical protein